MGRGCSGSLPHEVSPLPHVITRPHARPSLAWSPWRCSVPCSCSPSPRWRTQVPCSAPRSGRRPAVRRQPAGQSVDDGKLRATVSKGDRVTVTTSVSWWEVEGPLCRRGPLGQGLVADQRDQRQERQVAVRRALPLRRTEAVQGRCAAIVTKYAACSVRLGRRLNRCDPRGHHRRRHPRVHRRHGQSVAAGTRRVRADRVRVVVVPDHGRRRHERPDPLRRRRRVCRDRPVQGDRTTPRGPDADPDPDRSTPTPLPTPPPGTTEGIDISHWQGTIDWTQVAAAGKSSRS